MVKENCWEFKKCGREKGGAKVNELGECPVVNHSSADGLNGGLNGGRICWVITGTFCGAKVQGVYAEKIDNCMKCEFFQKVESEETSEDFILFDDRAALSFDEIE